MKPLEINRLIREVTGLGYEDFVNDLNAMYEVEEWLKSNHIKLWVGQYWNTVLEVCQCDREDDGMLRAVHATAAQRAEAFLRTIGKWIVL